MKKLIAVLSMVAAVLGLGLMPITAEAGLLVSVTDSDRKPVSTWVYLYRAEGEFWQFVNSAYANGGKATFTADYAGNALQRDEYLAVSPYSDKTTGGEKTLRYNGKNGRSAIIVHRKVNVEIGDLQVEDGTIHSWIVISNPGRKNLRVEVQGILRMPNPGFGVTERAVLSEQVVLPAHREAFIPVSTETVDTAFGEWAYCLTVRVFSGLLELGIGQNGPGCPYDGGKG